MRPWKLAFWMLSAALFAQSGRIEGPSLGIVWHEDSRSLRPVWGVFGAAWLGDPLPADADLEFVAVAPGSRWALARVARGGRSFSARLTWPAGRVHIEELEGFAGAVEPAVFSPSGIFAAAGGLRVGQPEAEAAAVLEPFAHELPEGSQILALSDAGVALLAVPDGGQWALCRAGAGRQFERLATLAAIDAAAFLPDSSAAFAASGRELYRLAPDGVLEPWMSIEPARRLAATADRLLAAHDAGVTMIDHRARAIAAFSACECRPSVLAPAVSSLFWLTGADAQPAWLLNAATAGVRFVPMPPAAEEDGQ
jgi:hypothetical protein